MTGLKFVTFICASFFLLSCGGEQETVIMHDVQANWPKKAVQHFEFEIKDSQHPKNIIFVVRNNNDYPYSNIRLIASLTDKKSKIKKTDTLNYILAEPDGTWIGTGFGATRETLFQYRLNHRFPRNGSYAIDVVQAMRRDTLPGIEDIGIKIETAKP